MKYEGLEWPLHGKYPAITVLLLGQVILSQWKINIQNLSEIESRYINSNNILGQRSSDEPGLLFSNQNTKKHKLTDKSLQHINDPRIVDTTTHLVPHLADGDSFLQNINPVSNMAEDLTHINVIYFLFIVICTTAIISHNHIFLLFTRTKTKVYPVENFESKPTFESAI